MKLPFINQRAIVLALILSLISVFWFAVTAGVGADDAARRFEREHDDYNAILVKALADRLAEAFAAYLHAKAVCTTPHPLRSDGR